MTCKRQLENRTRVDVPKGKSIEQTYDRQNRTRCRESGSIAILTLFAFALITGAFIYVALIGSRTAETTRARTSADATAMAAATVKAKIMNYESFLLLSESILLPLDQVTHSIRGAQLASEIACIGAAILYPAIAKYCLEYGAHMITTNSNLSDVTSQVDDWLDGLAATSEELQALGPLWAEYTGAETGMNSSYVSGPAGIAVAASFPIPFKKADNPPKRCEDLGLEMVGPNDDNGGKDACHGVFDGALQLAYIAASAKVGPIVLDTLGTTLTGNLLVAGSGCNHKSVQVPRLRDDWRKYRMSRGMALIEHPSDQYFKNFLEWANQERPAKTLQTGYLLGMGCAEHYSQNHFGEESLWNMDWRARLIPCDYTDPENIKMVTECWKPGLGNALFSPLKVPLLFEQFTRLRAMQISSHWRY